MVRAEQTWDSRAGCLSYISNTQTGWSSKTIPHIHSEELAGGIQGGAPVLPDQHPLVPVQVYNVTCLTASSSVKKIREMDSNTAASKQIGGGGVEVGLMILGTFRRDAEDNRFESFSVLGAHKIVEDRVECGWEEVEAAREVEEILVDSSVEWQVLEVDIAKTLKVERSPWYKEENNYRNWKGEIYSK